MTVTVPEPVPLEMPPGNVQALDELVVDVACAAYDLAVLSERLTGPAAAAPGWVGDDATAAATQMTRLAALTRECSTAMLSATGRLRAHADVLHGARRAIGRLRAEQDDDFASTWRRLGHLTDVEAMVMTGAPELVAVVADLEAAEAARRGRHAAVLAEVADDAAATAHALGGYSSGVGGSGAPGEAIRVIAYLSAALPGWGDAELAARGRTLARDMLGTSLTPEERSRLAQQVAAFARRQPFAEALLVGLGVSGVRGLLVFLGADEEPADGPVARMLAAAFSVAVPAGPFRAALDEVLSARYVRPDDGYAASDVIALGMSAVLGAAASFGCSLRPDVLVSWGRQLVGRDRAQGVPPLAIAAPRVDGSRPTDPLALVVTALADADADAAADLLATPGAWDVVLGRFWTDGGEALNRLLDLAASVPGERADAAIRSALVALGAGLADGDPADWTVSVDTASAVAPTLARALAAHVEVPAGALAVGVDGRLGKEQAAVLRGLGYLTLDRAAAADVEAALLGWARMHPGDLDATVRADPLAAVAVPSAYLAVRQYGQRLAYAMHGFEAKAVSHGKQIFWNMTFGAAVQATGGRIGAVLGGAQAPLTHLLGTDGTWDNGPDHGLVFDRTQAAELASASSPAAPGGSLALARQASAAFDRTLSALRVPAPPTSPDPTLLADAADTLIDLRKDVAEVMREVRHLPR